MSLLTILLALILAIAGCAGPAELRPAPDARTVPGHERSAVAEAAGVRMVVTGGAWSGRPRDLERAVIPVRVAIDDRSRRPLRVSYGDFSLRSATGFRYAPIPPYQIEGSVTSVSRRPVVTPRFASSRFYYAPYFGPHYFRGLGPWGDPWPYDPFYDDLYLRTWRTPLPTEDMLTMAIPEGVIEARGHVEGFLYFQRIDDDVRRVTFTADLVDARTGDRFATIRLPFVLE